MCGGTAQPPPPVRIAAGLSPRVRGNRPGRTQLPHYAGSIPACAGEPNSAPVAALRTWVYPRVCGGTDRMLERQMAVCGLSPRVRGNPFRANQPLMRRRSIPACAGEPRRQIVRRVPIRVYPRVCGGTLRTYLWQSRVPGLSPRVRGNPGGVVGAIDGAGSIPACAGEPPTAPPPPVSATVYPRVCGGTSVNR